MEVTKTLHVTTPQEWRAWLRKHYKTEKDIWLVYHKAGSGEPRIGYNDAVEQALCFGWIDSVVKTLDEERTVQRFSPRKPGAKYSQANIERLRALVARKMVVREVAGSLGDLLKAEFFIPPDILKAIKQDKEAWRNFRRFSDSYKRIRVAFIDAARKRPEEFAKRLRHFIEMSAKGRMYGFDGIGKYF
jgi:uncharacterized protein YdeI (YjbR/CyaY-like superfamily)